MALAFALTCVAIAGLVAVRGTLVGIGGALAAIAAIAVRSPDRRAAVRRIVAPAIVAVVFASGVVLVTPLGERAAHVIDDAGTGRLSLYDAAVHAVLARPVFGFGPDSFGLAYPAYRQPAPYGLVDPQTSAHDWILQAAVTTGLVGLGGLLVLVVSFGIAIWRAIPRAPAITTPILVTLAAYYANGLVAVGSISVDWVPWLCFGGIAAITGEARQARSRKVPSWIFPVLAVLAVGGLLAPGIALQANRDAGLARSYWTAGQTASAITAAENAVARDSGRAEYWNWLGLSRDQAALWRDAGNAYQEATERAPHEAVYWDNLALARGAQALAEPDVQAGQAAIAAALRAAQVDPNAHRVNETLADISYQFGDFDLALRGAIGATLLYDPSYGHKAFLSAQRLTDLASARRTLEDAVAIRDDGGLRLALAQIAFRMNDRADAETNALRALELLPGDRDVLGLLAQVRR
jgi:tetratricopeptide (TPR) repeat protein